MKAVSAYERLMRKSIPVSSGCIEWQGATRGTMGYSTLGNDVGKLPKMMYGHVVAYQHHHGTVPDGMVIRHSCDNPLCVNVEHLSIGSPRDNTMDMHERGRAGDVRVKLDVDKVALMRSMSADGASLSKLSQEFGISVANASRVIRRDTWKDVR